MSPPAFPITPEGLIGAWTFDAIAPGRARGRGLLGVRAFEVAHKGGRTFGYTRAPGRSSIGYVPDHAPELGVSDDALAAMEGVDVLIHDAQFLEHERPRAVDYGHATVDDAIRARRAGECRSRSCSSTTDRTAPTTRSTRSARAVHGERSRSWRREGMVLDLASPTRAHTAAGATGTVSRGLARADPVGLRPALPACRTTTGSSRPATTPTSSCWPETSPTS